LNGLTAIKKPIIFEVAVPHIGEEIHFYIGVPKLSAEVAMKQIQGLWNGASVELVQDDFNIFNANGTTAASINNPTPQPIILVSAPIGRRSYSASPWKTTGRGTARLARRCRRSPRNPA